MRLLLIEDERKDRWLHRQGLRQEGHVVDWSRNGEEGLGLALDAKLTRQSSISCWLAATAERDT